MTAEQGPGRPARRASDHVRLEDVLQQAFDEIEQMGARDPFRLTGDSNADLDRMADACAPAPLSPMMAGFETVRENLLLLSRLVGVGAVETTRRTVEDLHGRAAAAESEFHRVRRLHDSAARMFATVHAERDHVRSIACRLEEEIARDGGGQWLAAYVRLLEQRVGPDAIDVLTARANAEVAPPSWQATVVQPPVDAGLPVIDDATLGEGELVFRRDGETVAVGRLDRRFAPLDTANEIALGATQADGPPAGETVDVFTEAGLWPTGVEWRPPTEDSPVWVLAAAPSALACVVAAPACRPDEAPRPVDVGGTWACPLCAEAPRPYKSHSGSGPIDPPPAPGTAPRPPHHRPVA